MNLTSTAMSYPLMDALYSAIFRMTLEEFTMLEIKRHGCTADLLTYSELLQRICCKHGLTSLPSKEDLEKASLLMFHCDNNDDEVKNNAHVNFLKDCLSNCSGTELEMFLDMFPHGVGFPDNQDNMGAMMSYSGLSSDKISAKKEITKGSTSYDINAFVKSIGNLHKSPSLSTLKSKDGKFSKKKLSPLSVEEYQKSMETSTISLHRIISSNDKSALAQFMKTESGPELDLTLPLRGMTALSLSLTLKSNEMTKELLNHLSSIGQISRAINVASIDNTNRREPPIITAARTGQIEIIRLLLQHAKLLDLEARDGEGKTALWHSVREEYGGVAITLIKGGAKVFYDNEDLSCPLQLATQTMLLKKQGRKLVRLLVSHGANLEYVDHALRNALYWSVYNCCGEIVHFLLESGAKIKPWSWFEHEALPTLITQDPIYSSYIKSSRNSPPTLRVLARKIYRNYLQEKSFGKSIHPFINRIVNITPELKKCLKLQDEIDSKPKSAIVKI